MLSLYKYIYFKKIHIIFKKNYNQVQIYKNSKNKTIFTKFNFKRILKVNYRKMYFLLSTLFIEEDLIT